MEEDNVVNIDKGKGVLVPEPDYSDDMKFLFKKSKTREDDDVKLLELLNTHHHNSHASEISQNMYTYIQRETGELVNTDQMQKRLWKLHDNYKNCVDANGVIMPDAVALEKLSGRFSPKVFELSKLYWGIRAGDYMDDLLFDKSQSVKEDYITLLKYLRSYLSTNGGGFNPLKNLDFDAFQKFMAAKTKRTVSAIKLQQRVYILEERYNAVVARGENENPYYADPQDQEIFYQLRLIAIHHRNI